MEGRNDTSMGGAGAAFPATRWSAIQSAADPGSPSRRSSLNDLCLLYWRPVYASVRAASGAPVEEAKDITQEFFTDLIEGPLLSRFKPERGSFRAYLRGALDLFMRERRRSANAMKRGGGSVILPLEQAAPDELNALTGPRESSPEQVFDHQWANSVLDHGIEDLRQELTAAGKTVPLQVFLRHDISPPDAGPPTYADLAREFAIKDTDVTNHLTLCRRRLRELVVRRIRDYVSGEQELAEEIAKLFTP